MFHDYKKGKTKKWAEKRDTEQDICVYCMIWALSSHWLSLPEDNCGTGHSIAVALSKHNEYSINQNVDLYPEN